MDIINLESVSNPYTFVSNIFINDYMPEANGEFVKVYLFLLKLYNESNTSFNIDDLADKLLQTRSGIIRALKYWESKKLLILKKDGDSITNIRIVPIASDYTDAYDKAYSDNDKIYDKDENTSNDSSDDSLKSEETDTDIKLTAKPKKKAVSPKELENFKEYPDVGEMIFAIEKMYKLPLSNNHLRTIYFMYDELGFSADLITYLIEYCLDKDKSNHSYWEKVAISWSEAGIKTTEGAKNFSKTSKISGELIMNALGIKHAPDAENEKEFVSKWLPKFGYNEKVVIEACKRGYNNTHNSNGAMRYASKILDDWSEKNIKTLSDIEKEDMEFQKKKATENNPRRVNVNITKSSDTIDKNAATDSINKSRNSKISFLNFDQRNTDYTYIEQKMLEKRRNK